MTGRRTVSCVLLKGSAPVSFSGSLVQVSLLPEFCGATVVGEHAAALPAACRRLLPQIAHEAMRCSGFNAAPGLREALWPSFACRRRDRRGPTMTGRGLASRVGLAPVLYGGEQDEAIKYMCDIRYLTYHRRRGASERRFLRHLTEEREAEGGVAEMNRLSPHVAAMSSEQRSDRGALQEALFQDLLREQDQVSRNERARSASWLALYGPAPGAPVPMAMLREDVALLLRGERPDSREADSLGATDGSAYDDSSGSHQGSMAGTYNPCGCAATPGTMRYCPFQYQFVSARGIADSFALPVPHTRWYDLSEFLAWGDMLSTRLPTATIPQRTWSHQCADEPPRNGRYLERSRSPSSVRTSSPPPGVPPAQPPPSPPGGALARLVLVPSVSPGPAAPPTTPAPTAYFTVPLWPRLGLAVGALFGFLPPPSLPQAESPEMQEEEEEALGGVLPEPVQLPPHVAELHEGGAAGGCADGGMRGRHPLLMAARAALDAAVANRRVGEQRRDRWWADWKQAQQELEAVLALVGATASQREEALYYARVAWARYVSARRAADVLMLDVLEASDLVRLSRGSARAVDYFEVQHATNEDARRAYLRARAERVRLWREARICLSTLRTSAGTASSSQPAGGSALEAIISRRRLRALSWAELASLRPTRAREEPTPRMTTCLGHRRRVRPRRPRRRRHSHRLCQPWCRLPHRRRLRA